MHAAPFASLQARVDNIIVSRLANAQAEFAGGSPFGVLFERAPADPFGGAVDAASHVAEFCIANTPGIAQGSELLINGVTYVVAGSVQPDAGGWVSLAIYPKD